MNDLEEANQAAAADGEPVTTDEARADPLAPESEMPAIPTKDSGPDQPATLAGDPDPAPPMDAATEPDPDVGPFAGPLEEPATEPPSAEPAVAGERLVAETGFSVAGPFRAFYEHYGPTLCGYPISDLRIENGRPCQYFQCLALEEHAPGRVRLMPLGEAWLALAGATAEAAALVSPREVDLTARLPRHPRLRYALRPLGDIRYLVIHHTGAAPDLGPEAIATEHVEGNGWPGIGYHYLVAPDGLVYHVQDLTVASYHARQFNPVAVGIALLGDLARAAPPPQQLAATAALAARLLSELGLPPDALRGHREMVPTTCPGDWFLSVWKAELDRAVATHLVGTVRPDLLAANLPAVPAAPPLSPAAPQPPGGDGGAWPPVAGPRA